MKILKSLLVLITMLVFNSLLLATQHYVVNDRDVKVVDMTYHDYDQNDSGGVYNVYSLGSLELVNDNFYNNKAGLCGGAICSTGKGLISNSTIFNLNTATQGGAIYASRIATINSTIFSSNTAKMYDIYHKGLGGAIYADYGTITISSSVFTSNTATDYGGAIYNDSGILTISSTVFSSNTAQYGGAIYNGEKLNLIADTSNVEFTGNKANGISNAIHDNGGEINLWASSVKLI